MFARIEAVFFDLDGTLVDSVPDIAAAVDRLMAELGLPARGEAAVRAWVGNGSENLIRRAISGTIDGEVDAPLMAKARPLYRAAYAEHVCVHSTLYPGVLEGLEALAGRGLRMACVTNKPADLAAPLLERLGLAHHFATVVGGECTPAVKPKPDALLLAAARLGVDLARALMVGDSINDVGAARNAGCPVVCVPYGYNHGHDIRDAQPDAVIATLAELPALIA